MDISRSSKVWAFWAEAIASVRLTPMAVNIAHHVISAGKATLVVENAGMLPVDAFENFHGLLSTGEGRVELTGHLLKPA